MKLELPAEPIDQYDVTVWRSNYIAGRVDRIHFVYHVNTPWKVYAPDSRMGGADLVANWMVYINHDYADGRVRGWAQLAENLARSEDVFPTAREAAGCLIAQLEGRVAWLFEEIGNKEGEIARAREALLPEDTGKANV